MTQPPHLDPTKSAEERTTALLSQMTLAEKCHQLSSVMAWSLIQPDGSDATDVDNVLRNPPGHVAQLILADAATLGSTVARMQQLLVERTRLGIPALFHAEVLNGFLAGGHQSFPTPIGLAATWSPDLVEEMADLIRRQMIRTGMRHALSPVMDIAMDPRWGRMHETYGEDPYLVTAFSVAFTRALQTDDLRGGVVATGKHFLGYANPQGGVNASAIEMGWRRLRDVFAMPFEAAIRLAGLGSVMNTYSEIDGIPVAASHEVLTEFLRGVLGFDGFVSADYASIDHLVTRQGVASDLAEAGRIALSAGLDVEFPVTAAYGDRLAGEVAAGSLDQTVIDVAVTRVLRAKFALGLFEHPYPSEHIDVREAESEGTELSSEMARRGVVVLKNDGTLPVDSSRARIAVIGPHADRPSLQFATYTYPSWRTAIDAIHLGGDATMVGVDSAADRWAQALFEPEDPDARVRDLHGAVSLAEALGADPALVVQGSGVTSRLGDPEIERAAEAAQSAELVVLALGGASLWFNGERTEGEASDTADLELPRAQVELVEAVAATGTPYVVVLFQGRPYTLPDVVLRADAIVVAAYGGPFGAVAVAEVLNGKAEPSGRLPYSVPRHTGQVPVYHHQKVGTGYRSALPPSSIGHYLDMSATPLFPFGFGLSYTSFDITTVSEPNDTDTAGALEIAVLVKNTGSRPGAAVPQLYLRVRGAVVVRPFQQLAGFKRIHLEPAETRRVTFRVDASQLGASGVDRQFAVEPCMVSWFVGLDATDDERASGVLQISGPRRILGTDRVFLSKVSTASYARQA